MGGQVDELLPGVGRHSSSSAELAAAGVGGHSGGQQMGSKVRKINWFINVP